MTDLPPAAEHLYGIIPIRYDPSADRTGSLQPTLANTQVLLILQKTLHPSLPFFWTFPKGHAEPEDASPLAAALRELKEETGLTLHERNVLYRFWGARGGFSDGAVGAAITVGASRTEDASQAKMTNGDGSFMEWYINPLKGWIKKAKFWVGVLGRWSRGRQSHYSRERGG